MNATFLNEVMKVWMRLDQGGVALSDPEVRDSVLRREGKKMAMAMESVMDFGMHIHAYNMDTLMRLTTEVYTAGNSGGGPVEKQLEGCLRGYKDALRRSRGE